MTSITKNRLCRFVLLPLLVLIAFGRLGAQDKLRPVEAIRERKTLRVAALDQEIFPFMFRKGGQWVGYDVELAQGIAKAIGVGLEWDARFGSANELTRALHEGKADIALSRLKRETDAALTVRYTKPYVNLHYVLLTNRLRIAARKPFDESLASLNSLEISVGTLDNPIYPALAAKRFPAARGVRYPAMKSLAADLETGALDAVFCDEAEARFLFRERPELSIALGYYPLPELKSGIAAMVNWSEKHWAAWLDLFIDPLARSTRFEQLLEKPY